MSNGLTQAELAALSSPLANDARVLYFLGLRPTANLATTATAPIDYKPLLALLNGDNKEQPYQRGRQINSLLKQLEQAGLVALPSEIDLAHSINGKSLLLPLLTVSNDSFDTLHKSHYVMSPSWKPNLALFEEMAGLIGIIDAEYNEEDVGEFIAYWLGRPNALFSEFQWTQKFAYTMKRKRVASGYEPTRKIGRQQVKVAPGIEADDNARKLVEKYATSTKKS